MKRTLTICAAGLMALAAVVSCGKKAPKLTAIMDGPEPFCLLMEYAAPLAAEGVTAEAFAVPGREIKTAIVTDANPFAVQAEHWRVNKKDGKFVVLVLKGEKCDGSKHEAGKPCDKPEGEKCDSCKEDGKPCDKQEADKPCDKHEDGKPCEKHEAGKPCDKPEGEKCDSCKEDGKPCDKHEDGKPCDKHEDGKPCDKASIEVPEISVQQIADLKGVDGKIVKAWKKAVKATAAIPFKRMHGRQHRPAGPKPAPETE